MGLKKSTASGWPDRAGFGTMLIVLFAVLMVSQVQYDAIPDNFHSRQARIKLGILLLAGLLVLFFPRLLLFPILASYILFGMTREFYRLFAAGVGRVTGRPMSRRKHAKVDEDE